MYVTVLKIHLHFDQVYSIKDKRNGVNRVKMKLASRFKISVIEAEDQKYRTSSVLGASYVSINKTDAQKKSQSIENFLAENESDLLEDFEFFIEEF